LVSFGGSDPVLRLEFAKHLLAASVMAVCPGAIVISKKESSNRRN
jgi:CNT family concentrative nucleoside transporter